MLKASDILYEDGKYWIYEDKKKGFTLCRENGVCADIVGYASTLERAIALIKLQKSLRNE